MLVAAALGLGCGADDDEVEGGLYETSSNADKWVVGVYMAADNNLDGAASRDLQEMLSVGTPTNAEVLIYLDRTEPGDYARDPVEGIVDDGQARIYRFIDGKFEIEEEFGEQNSVTVETMHDFVETVAAVEADHRIFILWDHGAPNSFGSDETDDGHALGLTDIRDAFSRGNLADQPKAVEERSFHRFSVLGADACLMSSLDALSTLGPLADVYVASAELEPGDGWDYREVMRQISRGPSGATAPESLAVELVDRFYDYYSENEERRSGLMPTLAAWETSEFLGSGLDEFLSTVTQADQTLYVDSVLEARSAARSYAAQGNAAPNYIDFGDVVNHLMLSSRDATVVEAATELNNVLLSLRLNHRSFDEANPGFGLNTRPDAANNSGAFNALAMTSLEDRIAADKEAPLLWFRNRGETVFPNGQRSVDIEINASDDQLITSFLGAIASDVGAFRYELSSLFEVPAGGHVDYRDVRAPSLATVLLHQKGKEPTDADRALLEYRSSATYVRVDYHGPVEVDQAYLLLVADAVEEDLLISGLALVNGTTWSVIPWEEAQKEDVYLTPVRGRLNPHTFEWETYITAEPISISELTASFGSLIGRDQYVFGEVHDIAGKRGAATLRLDVGAADLGDPCLDDAGPAAVVKNIGRGAFTESATWMDGWTYWSEQTSGLAPNAAVQVIGSDVREDTTWSGHVLLRTSTYVHPGVTLTIEPGTVIFGEAKSALVITRGARIEAVGTAEAPIIFTATGANGEKRRGDWGGVVILGNAPNALGEDVPVEGLLPDPARPTFHLYGGTDPADSSGTLRYVRIAFAGRKVDENNALSGFTLASVGSGTDLSYVQVHNSLDDGFEFFGGTVNAHHLVVSNCGDDMFDIDQGYQGTLSTLFGRHLFPRSADPYGFEIDGDPTDASPIPTRVAFERVTACGPGAALPVPDYGVVLRTNARGSMDEIVVTRFNAGIDVRDNFLEDDATPKVDLSNAVFFGQSEADVAVIEIGDCANSPDRSACNDDEGFSERTWFASDPSNTTVRLQ